MQLMMKYIFVGFVIIVLLMPSYLLAQKNLPPLKSIRQRNSQEQQNKQKTISVQVNTSPGGATVKHGRKLLGTTPLTLTAFENSTPLDITIRHPGYMLLRTRIHRQVSRTYMFKLTPSKLR